MVDGGSTDETFDLATRHAYTARSAAGRAIQMNAGAALTTGDILWFIHVDCQIPAEALDLVRRAVADPGVVGGGLWRTTVLMQLLKLQYFLGVDPERIRRRYEAGTRRGRRSAAARTLGS